MVRGSWKRWPCGHDADHAIKEGAEEIPAYPVLYGLIFAATGIPELSICQPVKIIGLKPIIDEKNWQVDSINHKIDNKGLTTNFKMVLISLDLKEKQHGI